MKQILRTSILCSLVNDAIVCSPTKKTIQTAILLMSLINMMDSISVKAVKLVNL